MDEPARRLSSTSGYGAVNMSPTKAMISKFNFHRFRLVNWDAEEMEANKEEIIEKGLLRLGDEGYAWEG